MPDGSLLMRRSIIYWLLLIAASLAANGVFAQDLSDIFDEIEAPWLRREGAAENEREEEPDEIETDRDSFTPATTTVTRGRVIYESSYSFIENRSAANDHSFPEIITRFGITDRLEFRLGWNFEAGGGGNVSNGDPGGVGEEPGSRQESQILYGFKYLINKQRGWVPQGATIIQASTPTSGPDNFTDLNVGYVFGWKFFDNWQLDSAVRYSPTREEEDHHNLWAPSVVLKVPVHEKWTAHAEYFGIFTDGKAVGSNRQYFSPGIHYLVTPDCEIGIRVGWGLNQDSPNFFSNVGLGLQF